MKSLLLLVMLFCCIIVYAQQPGTLDPFFGNKGTVIDSSVINIEDAAMKAASNGRILIGTSGPYKGFAFTFKIDALSPDGSHDLSFGDGGSAYIVFPEMTKPINVSSISALALLPDGRILAAGYLGASGTKDDIAFARLLPNSTLDSSFGTNGTAMTSFGYLDEGAGSIVLQPDGKIVSAGSVTLKNSNNEYIYQWTVARFLPDGIPDESFGKGGIVVSSTLGYPNAVALQKDGKIVAAGYQGQNIGARANFHLERYNADGSYDKNFGENGIVDNTVGTGINLINDLALQQDGKLVVAGYSNGPFNPTFTIARYNTDGSIDNRFGKSGSVLTTFTQYQGEAKKVFVTGEKGDKIIAVGTNYDIFSGAGDFATVGYNMDGSPDADFGNNGIELADISEDDYGYTAALQTDGKVVEIGYIYSNETRDSYRALSRSYGYPTKVPLFVRIKRFLQNHDITWKGLPADDKVAYYSVEQSGDGRSGFASIAKVSGRGNLPDYAFTNTRLLQGTNYYRVKAVSTDGTVRYSEAVSADNSANSASVFPNPARSYVTVQGLPINATANITLKDGTGTVLQRGVSQNAQYRSQVGNLLPGTYYLNITTTGGKTEVVPFVKE